MLKIRTYSLLLLTTATLLSALTMWLSIGLIKDRLVYGWTERLISRESQTTVKRNLDLIKQEIELARELSTSPIIKQWADSPDDKRIAERAIQTLNDYRWQFESRSYFAALKNDLKYYQNDRHGTFTGQEHQITLSESEIGDQWFFKLLEQDWDLNLNVDFDRALEVHKLWINVPIMSGTEKIGITGTGFELTRFIEANIGDGEEGVSAIFTDGNGSIRLSAEQEKIVMGGSAKPVEESPLIFDYLSNPGDRDKLKEAFSEARRSLDRPSIVETNWDGAEHFFGVLYIPILDWYQITLVNKAKVAPLSYFDLIAVSLFGTLLVTFLALLFGLNRLIVAPLEYLSHAAEQFRKERSPIAHSGSSAREVMSLENNLVLMTEDLRRNEEVLEARVEERTRDLLRAERMSWVGSLAAGVAHEINSPLSYLVSNIATLRDYAVEKIIPELDKQIRDSREAQDGELTESEEELKFVVDDIAPLLNETHQGAMRIQGIVKGLGNYASLNPGIPQMTSLNDVVAMAVDLIHQRKNFDGELALELSEDADSRLVELEPKMLVGVVVTLVSNAIDACEDQSNRKIQIKTWCKKKSIGLTVSDNGIGITKEVLNKLFTPFFTTKPVGSGVGLGLAIAQKIVHSSGGEIRVKSAKGLGTDVIIEFTTNSD